MLYILLGVIAAVCAAGWLVSRISIMTLLWYMQEKGCPLPTDKDLKAGSKFIAEHILKDLLGLRRR